MPSTHLQLLLSLRDRDHARRRDMVSLVPIQSVPSKAVWEPWSIATNAEHNDTTANLQPVTRAQLSYCTPTVLQCSVIPEEIPEIIAQYHADTRRHFFESLLDQFEKNESV